MWNRSVHFRFAILVAFVLGILPVASHGAADTAATSDAKRVLRYIDELPNRTENRVIRVQDGRSAVPRGLPAGLLLLVEDGRQGVPVLVVP